MPTENPKISAYVPQVVYDRFKQYQEERQLSMSQAVAQLIVEHFGIDLSKGLAEQFTSELPTRLSLVEQELEDLKQKTASLSLQVDTLQSTSELPVTFSDEFFSELISRLSSMPLDKQKASLLSGQAEPSYVQLEIVDTQSNQVYNSKSELPSNSLLKPLEGIDLPNIIALENDLNKDSQIQFKLTNDNLEKQSELPSSLDCESLGIDKIKIKSEVLAQRLQVSVRHLRNKKSELNYEEFTKWTTQKDPNGVGWQPVKDGREVYYLPTTSLGSSIIAEQEDRTRFI